MTEQSPSGAVLKTPEDYIPTASHELESTLRRMFADVRPMDYDSMAYRQMEAYLARQDLMSVETVLGHDAQTGEPVLRLYFGRAGEAAVVPERHDVAADQQQEPSESQRLIRGYLDCIGAYVHDAYDDTVAPAQFRPMFREMGHSMVRRTIAGAIQGDREFEIERQAHLEADRAEANRVIAEEADRAANYDAMLGILNRRGGDRQLLFAMGEWDRAGIVGVIRKGMIDLTNFKRINDTLGHEVGDAALKEAVLELRETGRAGDDLLLIREGGDEIGVWFTGMSDAGVDEYVKRLHAQQVFKVRDGRYESAFDVVEQARQRAIARGGEGFISASEPLVRDNRIKMMRMVCVDGRPIIPVRRFSTLAIGWMGGRVKEPQDYKTLSAMAELRMIEHKAELHTVMGGRYDRAKGVQQTVELAA